MAVSWDPQIQVTSVLSNHLIAGILETVGGISLLRNFRKDRCSQARSRIMIWSNSRRGSWSCASYIQEISELHTVLHARHDFLCSKGKLEWAATVVRQAGQLRPVNPSLGDGFVYWPWPIRVYSKSMFYVHARQSMHHSLPAPKILLPSHRTKSEPPEQETASVGHAENMGTSLCKRVRGNETRSNYG